MWRKNIYPLLPLFVLGLGFYYYTQNFPHIFDVGLFDESGYMHRGVAAGLLNFSNYEWAPLYSLFYRAVSLVVRDPVDVYMVGGLLVLFAAFLLGALSIQLLSGNPTLAVLLASLPLFVGVFLIWPRPSFMVIAVLGLAVPLALRLRRTADKAALLTVVAFLLTFVRPEFITAFYLMLAVAAASPSLQRLPSPGRFPPRRGRAAPSSRSGSTMRSDMSPIMACRSAPGRTGCRSWRGSFPVPRRSAPPFGSRPGRS